jgi:hypothetical protein
MCGGIEFPVAMYEGDCCCVGFIKFDVGVAAEIVDIEDEDNDE